MSATRFDRAWAMPSADTMSVAPIKAFVLEYAQGSKSIVDPFARDCEIAHYRNDLNPATKAQYHMEAEQFLREMVSSGVRADLVLFDPPYSPRQIKECYDACGLKTTMQVTQSAALKARCRSLIREILVPGGVVLSFGWSTVGMGPGFNLERVLMVCHGGDHNDTLCIAERRIQGSFDFNL